MSSRRCSGKRIVELSGLERRGPAGSQRGKFMFLQVINQARGFDVNELQYSQICQLRYRTPLIQELFNILLDLWKCSIPDVKYTEGRTD